MLSKRIKEQFLSNHSAVTLCYGGVQGSAVHKFQTKVNVYKLGLFAIKFVIRPK